MAQLFTDSSSSSGIFSGNAHVSISIIFTPQTPAFAISAIVISRSTNTTGFSWWRRWCCYWWRDFASQDCYTMDSILFLHAAFIFLLSGLLVCLISTHAVDVVFVVDVPRLFAEKMEDHGVVGGESREEPTQVRTPLQ